MRENSIYTITPPDMQLLDAGPSVTIISTDNEFVSEVEKMHENLFKTVPVNIYYTDGDINNDNIAWLVSVMYLSDHVFVDLDTANQLGIIAAMLSESNKVFINQNNVNKDIVRLFNTMKDGYTVYDSLDDYVTLMLSTFDRN